MVDLKALKSNKILLKVLSAVLITAVLASVIIVGTYAAGKDASVKNYPLLEEYSVGNEPENTYWEYSVKDYTEKVGFKTSSESFKAPEVATVQTGHSLSWSEVSGADSYKLVIFNSLGEKFGEYTTSSLTQTVSGLSDKVSYRAQVQALKGTQLLSASKVRVFTVQEVVLTPDATSWSPLKDVTGATTAVSNTTKSPAAVNPEFKFGFNNGSKVEYCDTLTDYTATSGTVLGKYFKVGTNNDYYRYDTSAITVRIDADDSMDLSFTAPVKGTYYFSADVTTLSSASSFYANKLEFRVTKESGGKRTAVTNTVSITAEEKSKSAELTKSFGNTSVTLNAGESIHFEAWADGVCIFNIGAPVVSYLSVSENAEDKERSTTYLYTDFNYRAAYGDAKEAVRTGLSAAQNNPWRMAYFASPSSDGSTSLVYSSCLGTNQHLLEYAQGQSSNTVFRNTHNGTSESRFYLKANYGMAFEFTMPENGDLTLNIASANNTAVTRGCKYRWCVNGASQNIVQKSGESASTGGWYSVQSQAQIASFTNLKAGDVVTYEIYYTSGSGFAAISAPAAVVTCDYTPSTSLGEEFYEYSADGYDFFEGSTFVCDTYDKDVNTYTYQGKENQYILLKNEIKATLSDNALYASGISLKFTPDTSGVYDLSHRFNVIENAANMNSTVYYRVVEETADGDKLIYPESDWTTVKTSASAPTPEMELEPVLATLTAGKSVRIEAYADIQGDGSITVSIGNPCFTYVESSETSVGTQTVYAASDYFAGVQYNSAMTTYYEQSSRFKFRMLEVSGDEVKSVLPAKYEPSWSKGCVYTKYSQSLGFWYDKTDTTAKEEIFLYKTAENYGQEIVFVSPSECTLNLSSVLTVKGDAKVKVRVLKGDTVIWPENNGWLTTQGTTVDLNVKAEKGDEIKVQLITSDGDLVQGKYNPIFTLIDGEYANSAAGDTFSPLWERPYNNQNYTGSYVAPSDSVFDFNMVRVSDSALLDCDYFYSENNRLGRTDIENNGYQFLDDQLAFLFKDSNYGMSYTFTASTDGIYDISSALKIIAGLGSVTFNIKKGNTVICADTVVKGGVGTQKNIDAISVELAKGEQITVTALATETDGNLLFSMGEPTFIKLAKTERSGADTLYIYTPYGFTVFEDGRQGEYVDMTRRFAYTFEDSSGNITVPDTTDSVNSAIYDSKSGNRFTVNQSSLVAELKSQGSAKITFISPFENTASLGFAANLISGNAMYRLTVNGETVAINGNEWNSAAADDIIMKSAELDLKSGDKVVLEIKTDNNAVIDLGDLSYSFAVRLTDYTAEDESYSAIACNPFKDVDYTGKYSYDSDVEYWNYGVLDVSDTSAIKTLQTDYYDGENNRLYNKKTGTGYYVNDMLLAELVNTDSQKTGISLGFTAPRTDVFVFGSALGIETENTTADIYARITLNGEVVWPKDSDWHKTELSSDNVTVTVPAYEYSAVSGDEIRLEIYAENIVTNGNEAQNIAFNLGIPQSYTERTTSVLNDDITAEIHYQAKGYQYLTDSYSGKSIPMEKRWNIEYAEFTDGGYTVKYPDYYNSVTTEFSTNDDTAPVYNAKATTAVLSADSNKKGISLRLTSLADSVTFYECIPTITNQSLSEDTKVYFRVIRTPSEETDGEYDVIWPQNSDWEVLTSENTTSAFSMTKLSLNADDDIIAQIYAVGSGGENVNVSWIPTAVVAERYAESASKYSLEGGYTTYYQISPFWSYEYALDRNNPEYTQLETFNSSPSWLDWVSSKKNYIDIGESIFYIENVDSANGRFETMPIVSAKFTAPATGYYTPQKNMKALLIKGTYSQDVTAVNIRILLNGEKIWPLDSDWAVVEAEKTVSEYFDKMKLSEGDELRFEVTPYGELSTGSKFKLRWRVGLDYTAYDNVYSQTNDIYNMLTDEMYTYFKSLAASGEFDPDFAANKLISDQLKALRDKADDESDEVLDETQDDDTSNSTTKIIKKKKVTYITTSGFPWWIILIIIVGVLAVTATVLIILKKKGKIFCKKNKKEEPQDEQV